ncbi:MAG: 50S ribosomal protein L31 [Eggerthellaceae bacterium]|jgi:large subunit ribosomal protein L31
MKPDIHPEYVDCTVRCSCGNTFQTRSTKPEIRIDICNECHPFFTGTQKLIDTGGRVQRFTDKFGAARENIAAREAEKKAAAKAATAEAEAAKKAEREKKAAAKAERAAKYAAEAAKKAEAEAAAAAAAEAEAPAAEPEAAEAAEAPAEENAAE